jgi:putative transposase
MTVNLTHKIRLDPTCKQHVYFRKACGIARFAWNWALAKWEEKYKNGEKVNALTLKKEFNALKAKEFSWVYEVTKYACQQPFIHLQKSFQAFFSKRTKHPKYKKKGIHDSFYIGGDQLKIIGKRVKIPNLGWVRLKESLRFEGKLNGATISRSAGYWFISITIETEQRPAPCESQASVGVDLGVKTLATLSDGSTFSSNQTLKNNLARLRRFQRQLARTKTGSKNRIKVKQRIAKLHYKIACSRNDTLHKLTTHVTQNFRHIVIEDLDISSMLKNKKLSRSISNGSWYEFRRQIIYKATLRKNKIFVADKWFASSKKCSCCGNYKENLPLSERMYHCHQCKAEIDRDLNAAVCLKNLINTVSSTEIDACGQNGSVILLKTVLQPVWMNQELSPV